MEPRIQYAKTEDGVSIAYWTLGQGEPLVYMPWIPFGHIELEWQDPEHRRFCEGLARGGLLVHYDGRASGLSDRNVEDLSFAACARDLESVVDQLGLDRFALWAPMVTGAVAVAYAAEHPERVSRLILWCSIVRATDLSDVAQFQGLMALAEKDWDLFTETLASVMYGWSDGEKARQYASLVRESTSSETLQATVSILSEIDVSELLPSVKVPTLVLHRRRMDYPSLGVARKLASQIPDARLVVVDGGSANVGEETDAIIRATGEFLGMSEVAAAQPPAGDTHTILFTDMESSTALAQQLGDAGAHEVRRAHNSIVRQALEVSAGTEIKHTGDGIMASFSSASSALECSIAIQQGVASHVAEHPDIPLGVYVGLNAGEPIAEEQDLYGTSVDLAARLVDHAQPGQIIVSDVVRQLAAGKQFLFSELGETELRGFEDPVKLWELRWREDG